MKTVYPKVLLGKHDGENIFLSAPSWDWGWYWGFGYLGNRDSHYHVDGLKKIKKYNFEKQVWEYEFVHLYDGFKKHFGDTLNVSDKDLWTLCELFETFYTLKETAEVLGRGGAHMSKNPIAELIKSPDEVKRINEVVLPAVFAEIYKILLKDEKMTTTYYADAFNKFWDENYSGKLGDVAIMEEAFKEIAYAAWNASKEHTYANGD